ncbi:hypothetical protein [Streptomyces hoynatensis]|uniref:Protein kinase domain-containing protein n=1 Tax=Streptomyces hoynatensis TaxID=1141874 RepID=A0A3A9Z6A1_9ACTN|nr:hypothetical protein [Streptomyces hoynatensis]RKN43803.1 hypothetical protein D7294_08780 [Streptomyces hoynatensis]
MEPLDPQDPRHLGPYPLLGRLGGRGAYLGRTRDGRLVRLLTPDRAAGLGPAGDSRGAARRIDALRRVRSRWIVPVLGADPAAEVPWVATAYVSAPSLADALRLTGPLPADLVRRLAHALAGALADVHRAGHVWRDLTPAGVLLTAEGPLLDGAPTPHPARPPADPAVARDRNPDREPDQDQDGNREPDGGAEAERGAGTEGEADRGTDPEAEFAAGLAVPEELSGRPQGPSADLFRLGLLLAFAATGVLPAGGPGRGPADDARRLPAAEVPGLGGLPDRLEALIRRCLAADPAARPTAAEVARETAPEPGAEPWPRDFLDALDARLRPSVSPPGYPAGIPSPPFAADEGPHDFGDAVRPPLPAASDSRAQQPAGAYALGEPAALPYAFDVGRRPFALLPGQDGEPLVLPRAARQVLAAVVGGTLLVAAVLALPEAHGWWWPALLAAVWACGTWWGISAARRPTWAGTRRQAAAPAAPAGAGRGRAFLHGLTDLASFALPNEAAPGREGSVEAMLAAAYDRLGPPPPSAPGGGPGEGGAGRDGAAR